MKLTDVFLRSIKPQEKAKKYFDEGGLFLHVSPPLRRAKGNSSHWRFKYSFAGKENTISLGPYPEVSLKEARIARDEERARLRNGIDPSAHRKAAERARTEAGTNTFEAVGREWLLRQVTRLKPVTLEKATRLLEAWAFPKLGKRPIAEIETPELLDVLRRVEAEGKLETVSRLKQRCGNVFKYAIATGRAKYDPTFAITRGALSTARAKNHPTILEPERIGALLRAIDGFEGQFVTRCALQLLPLLFVRPGELRHAEWNEFDLDAGLWSIPASKMKMGAAHMVPLSTQAISILRDLQPFTGDRKWMFPGTHSRERPMSENTLSGALKRLGYSGAEIVPHGFRSMASTLLNESGWSPDVIERQLAHVERNEVRRAYNRAKYINERKIMMQRWADYLDGLRRNTTLNLGPSVLA